MSLEVFGDGGDVEDLSEIAGRYDYVPFQDATHAEGHWWNPNDDTSGDTIKTDQQMWDYVNDRRESESEDWACL